MPMIETLEGPLWRKRTPLKQWLVWGDGYWGCVSLYMHGS